MSRVMIYEPGQALSVPCTHPAVPTSGIPVRVGKICGIAETNERADGTTSVKFEGVARVSVHGAAAIIVGQTLYYHDTPTGSPATSVNDAVTAADAIFGTALEPVTLGATTSILVRLGNAALT